MAEPRRIELMSVDGPPQQKKVRKSKQTQRFELSLGDSTNEACPEFSYVELLKNVSTKTGLENGTDSQVDPLGEDDDHDKLIALARAFEDKYGTKPGKKKKIYMDLMDLGDGYDINDPFVDNSETHDEVVPFHLTTACGGFYINTGRLQFRENSDMEGEGDDEFVLKKRKKLKKQIINSDSECESGRWKKKKRGRKKKKLLDGSNINEKKRKKWAEAGIDGEKKKKKRKLGPNGEVIVKKRGRPKLNPLGQLNAPTADNSQDRTPTTTPADTNNEDSSSSRSSSSNAGDASMSTMTSTQAAAMPTDIFNKPLEELTTPNLPNNLPPSLMEAIEKLKAAAETSVEGKCKFFTPSVNKMLLDVELQARQLKPRICKLIYTHLAGHLPCGKETLMKRAKKLRQNPTNDKVKSTILKLSEAIGSVMPTMCQRHQEECKVAMEARDSKMNGEKEGGDGVEASQVDSDDEGRKDGGTSERDGEKDGKEKRFMLPRKKFEWNMDISCLLSELVKTKMEEYEKAKSPTETPEEFLRKFLDTEVKPLWPKGWIQTRMLFKESRAVHGRWTSFVAMKPRKAPGGSKPSTPSNSNMSSLAGVSSSLPIDFSSSTPSATLLTPKGTPSSPAVTPKGTPTSTAVTPKVTPSSTAGPPKVTPSSTAGPPKAAKVPCSSPTGNLLDYAEGSFASKARGHVAQAGSKQSTAGLSFTTTNTLGSTPAMQALQNIIMVDKAAKTPQITVSSPNTPSPAETVKTSTPQSSSFISSFLEFALKKGSPEAVCDDDSPDKGMTADSTQSQDIVDTLRSISALTEASRGLAGSVEASLISRVSDQAAVPGPQDSILTSTFQTPKGVPGSHQSVSARSILGQMTTPQQKVARDASQTWLPSNLSRPSTSPSGQASQRPSVASSADAARSITSTVNRTVTSSKPAHSASVSPHTPRSAASVASPSHSKLCPFTGQLLSSPTTSPKAGSQPRTSSPGAASAPRSSVSPHRPGFALQGSAASQASPTLPQKPTPPPHGSAQWGYAASASQRHSMPQTSNSHRQHNSAVSTDPRSTPLLPSASSQPSQRLPSLATSTTPRLTSQTAHTTATHLTTSTGSQLAVSHSQPAPVSTSHHSHKVSPSQQHGTLFSKPSPSRSPVDNTAATSAARGLVANTVARSANQVSSTNMLKKTSNVRTSAVSGYAYTSPGTVSSSSSGRKLPTMEHSFGVRPSQASGLPGSCMQASISPSRQPTASPTSPSGYAGYQPTHSHSPVSSPSQAALWRSADHVSSSSAYGLGASANGLYLQQTNSACQPTGYSAAHQAMMQQAADAHIHSSSMFGQPVPSPTHNLAQPHLLGHSPHHSVQGVAAQAVPGLGLHSLPYRLPYADSQSSQPY